MNIKQLTSYNGKLYEITLTEFEKETFLAVFKTASLPASVAYFKEHANPHREFYPSNESLGKVLIAFILGVAKDYG